MTMQPMMRLRWRQPRSDEFVGIAKGRRWPPVLQQLWREVPDNLAISPLGLAEEWRDIPVVDE